MSEEQNGNVTDKDGMNQEQGNAPDKSEKTVPYARFAQVNEQKKQAEETLSGIAEELMEDVPEDMREIVPNLPPAEKIKWLRQAVKKGFFTKAESKDGPDSKRPGGNPPQDFGKMSPMELISTGLKSKK